MGNIHLQWRSPLCLPLFICVKMKKNCEDAIKIDSCFKIILQHAIQKRERKNEVKNNKTMNRKKVKKREREIEKHE